MTTDEDDFHSKLARLNDSSVLQALRGVCEQIVRDLGSKNGTDHHRGGGKKQKSKVTVPCDNDLIVPLRSVLTRASAVQDALQRGAIASYLAAYIGEHVWVLDMVFGTGERRGGDGHADELCMAVFDAIEVQVDVQAAASFKRLLRLFRRTPGSVDRALVCLAIRRSVAALATASPTVGTVLDRPWVPWALALAALPLIDSRYAEMYSKAYTNATVDAERVLWNAVEVACEAMVKRPEVLVGSLSSKVTSGSRAPIETVIALVEATMQVLLGLGYRFHPDDMDEGKEKDSISGLLTVRWELEWIARALGANPDFRSFFAWDAQVRNRLMLSLLEDRDQSSKMADEFGRAVGLRCTPPQTLVALELLRASKASRDASDVTFARHIGDLLRAGMEGLYRPKEVMSAARNQEFASLGQRIQILISKNVQLDTMLTKLGTENIKTEDVTVNADGVVDEEVDALLSLIGVHGTGSVAPTKTGTPQSAKRKVCPERIGDVKFKDEVGDVDGGNTKAEKSRAGARNHAGSIHHNGRVVMPPTYNLDSESRELLWKEYLKDKDRLVEMLGDSNYRSWHDESRRPELRRLSGVDKAFDAIFGAGTAIHDVEGTIIDESGNFIELVGKKALDLCWTLPWDALLVGVLAVATDMVRQVQLGDEQKDHARLLAAFVDTYEVDHYVNETLHGLSEDDRASMKSCTDDFAASAGLAGLICITGTMRKILMHTTRHTQPELIEQYLELMQVMNARCFKDLPTRRRLRRSALLASSNLRACMSFPPLMGNAVSSKSSKLLPSLCALARDTESIVYTSACCWAVWHSLKSKRVPAGWIPDGVDMSTHPLCAAGVQQRCHFVTSSLHLLSAMVQEIDECGTDSAACSGDTSEDIIAALVASSSLCATAAVDLRKGLILYRSRAKNTKSAFQIVCEQKQVHLNVFSVASALCEIYCGLADDWDEFKTSLRLKELSQEDPIPHAGAVVFGFDFAEALQSYLAVLAEDQEAVLRYTISSDVIVSIQEMVSETKRRLDRVLKWIQGLDKTSEVYTLSAQQIGSAPAIVVLDTVNHYTAVTDAQTSNGTGAERKPDKKRKTLKEVENSFLRAALLEERVDLGDEDYLVDDDLSDLEDFIVTNPDVDYVEFLHDHFPQGQSDDDD